MSTDQPAPRVGDTITTAEQLDALPIRSVALNLSRMIVMERISTTHGAAVGNMNAFRWADAWSDGSQIVVLYRPDAPRVSHAMDGLLAHVGLSGPVVIGQKPDAPHSAPVDGDAVERAALLRECDLADAEMRKWVRVPVKYVRAALAAARAGEAEHPHTGRENCRTCGGDCRLTDAPGAGEAVDREALQRRIDLTLKNSEWLAEHDAQVLREASTSGRSFLGDECLGESAWLYIEERADRIAAGGRS